MKKKIKLCLLILVLFVCSLFANNKTYAIYREVLSTKVYLSVLEDAIYIQFDLNGATGSIAPIPKEVNDTVGILPTPTREGYNFLGWYTEAEDGTKVEPNTVITHTVTYHAHWVKYVCRKAATGTLHTETCDSSGVCYTNDHYQYGPGNTTITYGNIPGDNSPQVGDAYDCDVNLNDNIEYDPQTERFYFIRKYEDGEEKAVLVHYTSFDIDGQMDSGHERGSYHYDEALSYLPDSTVWNNPLLSTFDDKVSRFIQTGEFAHACGFESFNTNLTDFSACEYFLENTRFQSISLGRAGIWLEKVGSTYYRIQAEKSSIGHFSGPLESNNTARPVIEIPFNAIEGFKLKNAYNVAFNTMGGDPLPSIVAYENEAVGELPTPTREGYIFAGWFTNANYDTEVNETTIITGNTTFFANWEEEVSDLKYVFRIPGTCKFNGSNDAISSDSNNCISTVNPTNMNIDYTSTVNHYIDTGISLYSEGNYGRDYEIGFTIDYYDGNANMKQATLVNTKLENESLQYPGLTFRKNDNNANSFHITEKIKGVLAEDRSLTFTNPISNPINVIIERKGGVVSYSFNGGEMSFLQEITENDFFNMHTWFGAAGKSASADAYTTNEVQRWLKGTLSNMYIKLAIAENSINFDAHGGTPSFATKKVVTGTKVGNLPTVNYPGYQFVGWYTAEEGGTLITPDTDVNADITYHAHYTDLYNVTFDGNGGTVSINPNVIEVGEGYSVLDSINALPTATRGEDTFLGWSTVRDGDTLIDGTETINDDTTYYAKYSSSYTVTFDGNGGTVSINPNEIKVGEGHSIGSDNLPTATRPGRAFIGWSTVRDGGTIIDGTETINDDTTYYARYIIAYTVTFDGNGGTPSFASKEVGSGRPVGDLPTAEREGYIFDGWYMDSSFNVAIDPETTIIEDDETFIANWIDADYVAEIDGQGYTSLALAVAAVPTDKTKTTIKILTDITGENITIENTKNIVLDINGHTISSAAAAEVIINFGELEIKNGTVLSNPASNNQKRAIENKSGGILTISSGMVKNDKFQAIRNYGTTYITGGTITIDKSVAQGVINNENGATLVVSGGHILNSIRQAIYNDGGTVTIKGNAHLENGIDVVSHNTSDERGTLQNNKGTMNILGGTIKSGFHNALVINNGTVKIGTQDSAHDITAPVIVSESTDSNRYGVFSQSTNYSFYDGIIMSKHAAVNDKTKIGNRHETDFTEIDTTDENGYNILYYENTNKYTITLDPRGGDVSPTAIYVTPGSTVGTLPTPTKGVYIFDGWYDSDTDLLVDGTETPDGDKEYYASWSYTPSHVEFNIINDTMREYYTKIGTWKNNQSTFQTNMDNNFNSHGCFECNAGYQSCPAPSSTSVLCDKPKGYSTGISDVVVYESDENTKAKGVLSESVRVDSGVIYNMIPGKTYYWESASDTNIYGTVKAVGERRIIDAAGVRNVRDLGGLEVDVDNNGTIDGTLKYEKLYRGPKLQSSADVTSIANLGVTEEVDLRGSNNDPQLNNYLPLQIVNYEVDRENYPSNYTALRNALTTIMEHVRDGEVLYFHCAIGTDRTGTLAYFLEGLLGVSEEDRLQDYELSYFYGLLNRHRFYNFQSGSSITHRFDYMHNKFTTNAQIYAYYMQGSTNTTADEQLIQDFRNAMINYN